MVFESLRLIIFSLISQKRYVTWISYLNSSGEFNESYFHLNFMTSKHIDPHSHLYSAYTIETSVIKSFFLLIVILQCILSEYIIVFLMSNLSVKFNDKISSESFKLNNLPNITPFATYFVPLLEYFTNYFQSSRYPFCNFVKSSTIFIFALWLSCVFSM